MLFFELFSDTVQEKLFQIKFVNNEKNTSSNVSSYEIASEIKLQRQ